MNDYKYWLEYTDQTHSPSLFIEFLNNLDDKQDKPKISRQSTVLKHRKQTEITRK